MKKHEAYVLRNEEMSMNNVVRIATDILWIILIVVTPSFIFNTFFNDTCIEAIKKRTHI